MLNCRALFTAFLNSFYFKKCVPVVLEEIANGENQDRDYFKMLPDEIMVKFLVYGYCGF